MFVSGQREAVSWIRTIILALCVGLIGVDVGYGLGQEALGPADDVTVSPDWPAGVREVLIHPARVYWWWVNGNEHAYFDGNIAAINDIIRLYSEIQMKDHDLIIRPGTAEANTFGRKKVPYRLMFEVPGGIYFSHAMEYAKTGLYTMTPRLTLQVDDAFAKDLDKVKIPPNVTLRPLPCNPECAARMLKSSDRSVRWNAVRVLGEIGPAASGAVDDLLVALDDNSDSVRSNAAWALGQIGCRDYKVIKALEKATRDSKDHVRDKASASMNILAKPVDPKHVALRQHVAAFIEKHPTNAPKTRPATVNSVPQTQPGESRPMLKPEQLPTADDLMVKLREFDELYQSGFTATGTYMEPSSSGYPKKTQWTLSMGDDRLALIQRHAITAGSATRPVAGKETATDGKRSHPIRSHQRTGTVIFTCPEFIAHGQTQRIITPENRDGVESTLVTLRGPGRTYSLLIGKVLWSVGRGYADSISAITGITDIEPGPNGLIAVKAPYAGAGRWELLVDPEADYMVRSAKLFLPSKIEPWIIVTNSGLRRAEGRCLPERAVWSQGHMGVDMPFTFESFTATPDLELIRKTEMEVQNSSEGSRTVMDERKR